MGSFSKTSKSQRLSKEGTGAGLSRTGGIEGERLIKKNDNADINYNFDGQMLFDRSDKNSLMWPSLGR